MNKLIYGSLCSLLLLTACQDTNNKETAVSEEAKITKPVVAIVPLIDNSNAHMSWNLSDEFTYSVYHRLDQKSKLSLSDVQKIRSITRKFQPYHNPFGTDLKWVKKAFPNEEFIVFTELMEHNEMPINPDKHSPAKDCSANLSMSLRIRVLDLREADPKVVLQEIINDNHFIPRQFNQYNFHQIAWGNEEFNISPVGIAHTQLIKEISSHIEDYILMAKSG